jgi:hypothetical protein
LLICVVLDFIRNNDIFAFPHVPVLPQEKRDGVGYSYFDELRALYKTVRK